VFSADCATVGLASADGVIGIAHAGWRGLRAGVIENTVRTMRDLGATDVLAAIGPCIGPECYEFGAAELAALVERYGPQLCRRTSAGAPALHLAAGVRAALVGESVRVAYEVGECTACSPGWFSYRARRDTARQVTVIWRPGRQE